MKNIDCREISKVSDTGLLIDGRDYYRAFCAASESAERHILLSGWQFDSDVQMLRDGDGNDTLFPKGIHRLTNILSRGIG
jgi:phosphatidylserine/phosphatidylglycerophosphate/cardiolipin synthase-like enzyme